MSEFNDYGMNNQPDNNIMQNQNSQFSDSTLNQETPDQSSEASGNPVNNNPGYNYNQSSNENMNDAHTVYPVPQLVPNQVKPKKKHGFFKAARFVAAGVAFGVIAGVATSGYNYFSGYSNQAVSEEVSSQTEKTPITVDTGSNKSGNTITTNSGSDSIVSDVSDVVSKVMPSIVAINSKATVTNYDFFGRQSSEDVQGSGSGIIIDQDDSSIIIATNNHVIDGASSVEVVFADESTVSATIKSSDAGSDLAVVEVKKKDLKDTTLSSIKVATLGDSTAVKTGEMAIAIGNALGYGQSVTVGYISAVNREVEVDGKKMTLLQTDAAINPGNSGGALLNAAGQVIGINSVKFASTEVEGMGYAIPISDAIPMINELMNRQEVSTSEQGFLGINLESAQEVTEEYAQQFNLPVGVYVKEVVENSPAEKAGLKAGNIITGINNTKIETIGDLQKAMSYCKAGEKITLKVSAASHGEYTEKDLTVTLGKKS